ncbi:MAG: hypothetical protein ACXIUL_02690 [Wenzhouxiangella sp.]
MAHHLMGRLLHGAAILIWGPVLSILAWLFVLVPELTEGLVLTMIITKAMWPIRIDTIYGFI